MNPHPSIASELANPENWLGGFYGLALEYAEGDDSRLEAALKRLWQAAGVLGCYAIARDDAMPEAVALSLAAVRDHRQLRGVVQLPSGHEAVCGVVVTREREAVQVPFDAPDWLFFFLPLGALARLDGRLGGYPFGDFSLEWRRPIDEWMADLGATVYSGLPFRLGLIGMEVSGEADAERLQGQVPEERSICYLIPRPDGLRYFAATV